jgi:hypothetical protein
MNQNEIFMAAREYLERTVDEMPDSLLETLTRMAEGSMSRALREHPNQWRTTELVLSSSEEGYNRFALPSDYLGAIEVRATGDNSRVLSQVFSMEDLLDNRYLLGAGQLLWVTEMIPTVGITYQAALAPLTNSASNWVADNFGDVYVYGIMSEAGVHGRNKNWIDMWTGRFRAMLGEIQLQGWNQRLGSKKVIV